LPPSIEALTSDTFFGGQSTDATAAQLLNQHPLIDSVRFANFYRLECIWDST
jgi:hypothetical protein